MTGTIEPGSHPPLLIPYCRRCDQPVEEMKFDVVSSAYYVGIQVKCCGYTSGTRVSVDEVFRLRRTKEKLYMNGGAGRATQLMDPVRHRRFHP